MFQKIKKGGSYSLKRLAELWGYASFHALARGVVTPQGANKIILFVTEDKRSFRVPYQDKLHGDTLSWEGPTDHFAEQRIVSAGRSGDEIHLFYRKCRPEDFVYLGQLSVQSYQLHANRPSLFVFQLEREDRSE